MKIENALLIGIQRIEWFKELSGFSNEQFLEYMNKNNIFNMLDDPLYLMGCVSESVEELMDDMGRFLTKDERAEIISRYYSKNKHG